MPTDKQRADEFIAGVKAVRVGLSFKQLVARMTEAKEQGKNARFFTIFRTSATSYMRLDFDVLKFTNVIQHSQIVDVVMECSNLTVNPNAAADSRFFTLNAASFNPTNTNILYAQVGDLSRAFDTPEERDEYGAECNELMHIVSDVQAELSKRDWFGLFLSPNFKFPPVDDEQ